MNLPEIAIRRPVFAFMLSAILVIFGIISFFKIGLQETPNITFPEITVTTYLPGANPNLVNQTVTKPIEGVLNTISGVQHISSTSTQGKSEVDLQFAIGADMNAAFMQTQSLLNQVRDTLPEDAKSPVISQANTSGEPIVLLALYGNSSLMQLNKMARDIIKPKLENINGVGSVTIEGSGEENVYINLNLNKMAALQISPADIQNALSAQHVQAPGGFIQSGSKQYALDLNLEFHTIADLKNMTVIYRDNAPVKLKDIATVDIKNDTSQQFAEFNGLPTVGVSIIKKSEANTVKITDIIRQRIKEEIKPLLPSEIKLTVAYAAATSILQIVHSLERDIWLSIIAAGLIIWLFLRNIRSTFVIVTAIPVSLLGVVMVMYFTHYTFNVVTLLGLILLVGVVVDDAIVVLENIFRKGEELHLDPMTAALQGSKQVLFAVIASSLTLISIFLPVVFMSNIVGLFFKSFAIVVSVGVLISLFVSLTLTPMLCSRFFKFEQTEEKTPNKFYQRLALWFNKIEKGYTAILYFALRFRWLMMVLAVIMVLISIPLFINIGKAFLPADNNSGYFYINLQTPQGSSTAYTKTRIQKIENILQQYPEIQSYYTSVSQANQGNITVQLVPSSEQTISQQELMPLIEKQLHDIPGMISFVSVSGQAGNMTFSVLGPDYNSTMNNGIQLYNALQKYPKLGSVYVDMSFNQPQYITVLDRPLASSLGISAKEVTDTLMILGQGTKVAKFNKVNGADRLDIVLRATPGEFTTPQDIADIYLLSNQGAPVRLDTVATLYNSFAPVSVNRLDMNYSIGFSTTPKIALNKAVKLVQKVASKVLPKGYVVQMTGNTASMSSTDKTIVVTFCLIILLIYMVLASQFNSFIQPFIILIAQPLALIGGVLVLWITGQTLNIYSMIGILLLMGLVAKNSILLIDLTNQLRREGKAIKDALLIACPLRMRPVLMTSLAIIFAMLPSAIIGGPGSESHRPLALVIIGGMFSSTILTLIIVPAFYSLIENGLQKIRRK